MPVTYYVALPFVDAPDGPAPGQAMECQSEMAAVRLALAMSTATGNVGALAFRRSGEPEAGEFSDAEIIRKFGDVPTDLSDL